MALSKSKAAEILKDGTVHGHKLTDKQRRFMGARASGMPPKRVESIKRGLRRR